MHRMTIAGAPLEDTVSRRALRRAYAATGGDVTADVREIAALARAGDEGARGVLERAFSALGGVVGACVTGFGADVLIVGGSMAGSWDLLAPAFRAGAGPVLPPVRTAADSQGAPFVGAAVVAVRAGAQPEMPVDTEQ